LLVLIKSGKIWCNEDEDCNGDVYGGVDGSGDVYDSK
jgi:hypothetical protein